MNLNTVTKISGVSYDDGLHKHGLLSKFKNILWGIKFFLHNGIPRNVFRFGGGLGDHLMVSSVFHEYRKRGEKKTWMMSDHPDVFEKNIDSIKIVSDNWRVEKYCSNFGVKPTVLSYGNWIGDNDRILPPKKHIIIEIMERAGLLGEVEVRPWYNAVFSNENEFTCNRQVCIQGAGTRSSTEMQNKQWDGAKYAELAEKLSQDYDLVQLGMPGESEIPSAKDFRGKLTIQQTAKILAESRFFVGQVGFLMHLARAVGTRSAIIYGGREKAWQSGYPCNENIETSPPCSPCWQCNTCDHDRMCLEVISVENVLEAINRLEERLGDPLETQTAFLG